jgi:phosphatidylglycerol:prolipoprotein diacylglycerol transferase
MAPGAALGYALARAGCFLNGCCYGAPTHLPWGVRFQNPALPGGWTEPSHPVQVYALFANLMIFVVLLRVLPRKRYDGQVTGLYFILYSTYRFLAEFSRKGVTGEVLALGITQAQWASLALIVLAVVMMRTLSRRGQPPSATGEAASLVTADTGVGRTRGGRRGTHNNRPGGPSGKERARKQR